ncbi:mechanosensitive ion channel protein MscS, partial [Microcoleus sp. HI-ES]|nr:mechanosensitive ion channel protein MscS [Microcoleus sp. HI-ES]
PEEVLTQISQIFTTTLLKIGENPVSLQSLVELIVVFMAILVIARSFTNFLKERLLVRLGIDEGNREAIAVIIGYLIVALGVIVAIQSIG